MKKPNEIKCGLSDLSAGGVYRVRLKGPEGPLEFEAMLSCIDADESVTRLSFGGALALHTKTGRGIEFYRRMR